MTDNNTKIDPAMWLLIAVCALVLAAIFGFAVFDWLNFWEAREQ